MSKRLPQLLVAFVALFGAIAITVALVDRSDAATTEPSSPIEIGEQLSPEDEALRSGQRFLDTYVESDGRVVRSGDEDTVSEGQAYAMLIAVALDESDTFDSVWAWTQANLLGESGTLAWRWKDGNVLDPNAATDADLDASRALVMAAERFDEPSYLDDGVALAEALFAEDVVEAGDVSMLVAGPWATTAPHVWNPSYLSPATYDLLATATKDPRWSKVREDGTALLASLTDDGEQLPSDWALLDADGVVSPTPAPDGADVAFGFDAFRTMPRLAEACDEDSRGLAVNLLPATERAVAGRGGTADLDGNPIGGEANPLFLLSAAAGADAAGDDDEANSLVDQAEQRDAAAPSYYLGAWIALTRIMIDTDRLDVCNGLTDQ